MYSRQQASILKQSFWTAFGRYMAPVPGAEGKVNWMNYKTGVRHIYFRMDVTNSTAAIGIELTHPDKQLRLQQLEKMEQLQPLLQQQLGETWDSYPEIMDENGRQITIINTKINGVNIFSQEDWPRIISFLKPRIMILDVFWAGARWMFE